MPRERRVLVGSADTAPLSVAQVRVPDDRTVGLTCDALASQPPATVGVGPAPTTWERRGTAVLTTLEAWAPLTLPVVGLVLVVVGARGMPRVRPHLRT